MNRVVPTLGTPSPAGFRFWNGLHVAIACLAAFLGHLFCTKGEVNRLVLSLFIFFVVSGVAACESENCKSITGITEAGTSLAP